MSLTQETLLKSHEAYTKVAIGLALAQEGFEDLVATGAFKGYDMELAKIADSIEKLASNRTDIVKAKGVLVQVVRSVDQFLKKHTPPNGY